MNNNIVMLDKIKHKTLKLNPLHDFSFMKEVTHIPITMNESTEIGNDFPIVFTNDENPSLIALVSLGGECLAVDDGKWIPNYIPNILKKYPFSLVGAQENADQKMIAIDEDAKVLSKSRGKQLFKKSGEQSDILQETIEFLTAYEKQMFVTKGIAKIIYDSGILIDQEIAIGKDENKKVLVQGFKVVDIKKLNELSDATLADWVRKGVVAFIYTHIRSIEKTKHLFSLAQKKQA